VRNDKVTRDNVWGGKGDASRRAVMGGFVGLGVAVPLLAACGSEDSESAGDGAADTGDTDTGDTDTGSSDGGSTDGGGTTSSGGIATTSEIPVGSGKIIKAEKVVLTQPTEGQFKAFSAICTHQGCPVAAIKGKDINCTCHGSVFSIVDGSVVKGPADKPLEELKVTVTGEDLTVS